ncbi:MAG: hypothetical protein AB7R90_18205 [Reyranellaceae bacterium]
MDNTPKPIRSPSYPNMALGEAIEAVGKIERQYRSAPVDRTVAAKLIGYTVLSGPANKALAALASYGLLDRAGKGEARVTERARDILHAGSEEQRKVRILEAALEPELFRELRERFEGIAVPPEDGVITYLNRQGFNPNAVRPAARAFLETMSYLEELNVINSQNVTRSSNQDPPRHSGGAAVGDLVQWEVSGVIQLPEPRRVRAISDDGNWVFVEQSETGIPMEQVIVEQKGGKSDVKPPILPLAEMPIIKGTRREVFALDEGDVVLTFPDNLSKTSFEDLDAYLKVFISKMRRRAESQEK